MRTPNLTRMRKVNYDALLADYPVRYVLGLPVDSEIPDFTPGAMWTLPDPDVTLERRRPVNRWTMRRVEVDR